MPFLGTGGPSVAVERDALRAPGDADQLETRVRACIDQVARRVRRCEGSRAGGRRAFEHQAEPVLAGVGIFPAEQTLARAGRGRGRKTTNRLPVERDSAREGQQRLAVKPEHRAGCGRRS